HIAAEGLRRERADEIVAVAVRGDLVPRAGDPPHQGRQPLRHPAKNEPGAVNALLGHELQDALDIAFDTQFAPVPAVAVDDRLQVLDVEPVFHVDADRGRGNHDAHAGCLLPMMRAGTPPTMTSSSATSLVTTAPAA